ncbi:MAG TPA: DedA family protein, partial [Negativicutes bacterium]|nr:DedA family protein [Negativicutes bacterium]
AAGIAVWCTLAVSFGYYFGQNWHLFVDIFSRLGTFVVAALAVCAMLGVVAVYLYLRRQKKRKEEAR